MAAFRAAHPLIGVTLDNIPWQYIACGRGAETVLLLPGAPGRADTAFEHILALEPHYRIIAPDYPPQLSSLGGMIDGISALLAHNGAGSAHVAGGSYSGLIAQAFVRRYPGQTRTLILSDTGVPRRERARKYARYLKLLRALPLSVIRALWHVGALAYVREIKTDRPFWRGYFRQLIATISKQECVGRLKIWVEFDRSLFTPNDLAGWPGKILILEAAADATFPPYERAALRALYPGAQTHTFDGGGHAASISQRYAYISAMRDFLKVTNFE